MALAANKVAALALQPPLQPAGSLDQGLEANCANLHGGGARAPPRGGEELERRRLAVEGAAAEAVAVPRCSRRSSYRSERPPPNLRGRFAIVDISAASL